MPLTEIESKTLNRAVVGGAGGVVFLLIGIATIGSSPGEDPLAGLEIMGGTVFFFLFAFWLSGLINVSKVLGQSSACRRSAKAIGSYIMVSIPPVYVAVAAML